jgi:ubiquinone/menaquinone biosynthesis C-methylase UbiE
MTQSTEGKTDEVAVQDRASTWYEHIRYERWYSRRYHDWWTSKMLSLINPQNLQGLVLDNGCGVGMLIESMPKGDSHIIGLDISAGMIGRARKRMTRLVLGDSQKLPFRDSSFDMIIARSLLHHLPDPPAGITEMARVLKETGEVVLVDTNRSLLNVLPRWLTRGTGHFSDEHKNLEERELRQFVEEKFNIDTLEHFGYLAYPIGFPDVVDIFRYVPFKRPLLQLLIRLDERIAALPFIKSQSWGLIVKASKKRK